MPRFVGKQSNTAIQLPLFLLLLAAILTGLEYSGAINLINGFGSKRLEIHRYPDQY
ncbi:hypothetical protein [Alkalinema sp. FACHB-956]|uniref:hypothetical protein n=1 Tax=Alkalinema sp. FACHB-956 TaxID=2692768 RepID=UPI00168310E0|nr:hypothetical protein [Alkalinema sp. FACHB-956]MBD2328019.1 hypothetical protein [Alkalinema sp. FACHB-956]